VTTVPEGVTGAGSASVAAFVLGATFLVAAVTKLRDPAGAARGFADLGVPRPWLAARAVPLAEVVVAAAVLVVPTVGSVVAAVVLAAFSVFLVDRLRAGVRAPCSCFGVGRRHPLSAADPLRNALLIGVALLVGSTDRLVVPSAVEILLGAVVVAAGGAILRSVRRVLARVG